MATTRRTPRSLPRRPNPLRDLVTEKQRALELARSRERVQRFHEDLPSMITEQVGEHMQKLETKLVENFRELGQRVVEESANVLTEQLGERITALEQVSEVQTRTIVGLRDSSRAAEQKVSSVVSEIERALAGAVPGFKLEPAAYAPMLPEPAPSYAQPRYIPAAHDQFRLEPRSVIKAPPRAIEESEGKIGFCPSCTSTNVRRATRQGLFEEFLRLFFIAPFRCRSCRHKFYRF